MKWHRLPLQLPGVVSPVGNWKAVPQVVALFLLMVASLFAVFLLHPGLGGVEAQQTNSNTNSEPGPSDECKSVPEGAPCIPQFARECRVGRCRGRVCKSEPVRPGTACRDSDGNSCTLALCSPAGTCEQESEFQRDGVACTDDTPACVGGQTCARGRCVPPGDGGDPAQVPEVSVELVGVEATEPRVRQATAFNDCCDTWVPGNNCEEQYLEALVPTSQGPKRVEEDGGLPMRRKLCGTITKYGVNDELEDPRDININFMPTKAAYRNFVAGFVKTDETPASDSDKERFGPDNCERQACLDKSLSLPGKVIHAEVTPHERFFGADGRFLPIESSKERCGARGDLIQGVPKCLACINGWECESELEPRNGSTGREGCVYGVYAFDHGSHAAATHPELCCPKSSDHELPEIHPFDAIWWRHPDRNGWIFGVFQDFSNRYSYPYCGPDNNCNEWSKAPRDLTFRFPFRFPRNSAVQKVCLRHVRTRTLKDDEPKTIRPLNVTTGAYVTAETEVTTFSIGERRMLQVLKEPGSERETHISIIGRMSGDDVVGIIILRVAVGCDERAGLKCVKSLSPRDHTGTLFENLGRVNTLVTYDRDHLGAGYYYAELAFQCACP